MFDWRAFWVIVWIYVVGMTWFMVDKAQFGTDLDMTTSSSNAAFAAQTQRTLPSPLAAADHYKYQASNAAGDSAHSNELTFKLLNATTSARRANEYDVVSDQRRLIDLTDFSYRIEQPPCAPNVQTLILVHTAPRNTEKRALIRETWGGDFMRRTPMRLLFLLGDVGADSALRDSIDREAAAYEDMVQGSFHDDYRNLTYKHVMALKWTRYNCPRAQILIKVDDDVFVNSPLLLKNMLLPTATTTTTTTTTASSENSSDTIIAQLLFQSPRDLLLCHKFVGSRVKRSYRSKWRVKLTEYAGRYYPPYCPGYAIIYSTDVAVRLYEAAQKASYFWIDDVQITGVMAERTNTSITTLKPYLLPQAYISNLLTDGDDSYDRQVLSEPYLFAGDNLPAKDLRQLWRFYSSYYPIPTTNLTSIAEADLS